MKKVLLLIILLLYWISISNAQSLEYLINGPVEGLTSAPASMHGYCSVNSIYIGTNTVYNQNGESHTYKELNNNLVDPKITIHIMNLTGKFAFTKYFGVSAELPYITHFKATMNPIPGVDADDIEGDTGIGDLTVGGWLLTNLSSRDRIEISAGYKFATGASPYDEESDAEGLTAGSGYTSIMAGLSYDILPFQNALLSAGAHYIINSEFEEKPDADKSKIGNGFILLGQMTYRLQKDLSLGVFYQYRYYGKTKTAGQVKEDTESTLTSLTPTVGVQFRPGSLTVNTYAGYMFSLKGKNQVKENGFFVGVSVFI